MDITDVLKRALKFFDQVQKATDDESPGGKKIKLIELPGFIAPVLQLLPIFSELKEVAASFKDMTDQEKQDAKDNFKAEFDLQDDVAEEKVERSFNFLIELGDFVSDYRSFSVPPAPGTGDDE